MPKTLILDSSQLQCYLECPRRWQLNYQESLTRSTEPREDFAMGTFGHKMMEIFYTAKREGCPISAAASQALLFANSPHPDFPLSEDRKAPLVQRFNDYWMTYSQHDIEPQIIEKGFSYPLLDNGEFLFVLEGRIDLIGHYGGQTVFMDHKFQSRQHQLYSKSIQFRNYALAANLSMGIINYIRLHKAVSKDTLCRQPINFSSLERDLWKNRLIEIYKTIVCQIEVSLDGRLPLNEAACSGKFGIPCEFTPICEEQNPNIQIAIQTNYYHKKEEWKPW